MELGVQVRGDWDHVLWAARWAEERGLEAIALPDHYLQRGDPTRPAWDHLVHIAGLARETSSIELVSMVSPVGFRHPAVLYKLGVTIDEISGGRFTLGVGAGWMDEEFERFGIPFPDLATRMEMLEETLAYLRAATAPGASGFDGKHFRLSEFDPHPHPRNLRIMSGGEGKAKARSMAARYVDEYNLYACPPERYSEVRSATRGEAVEHGRDPESIFWSSAGPALAARSETDYQRLLRGLADLTGRSTERIEEVYVERSIPFGSGSRAAEMLSALEEAGCQRYYPQIFRDDPADFDVIMDAYSG